MTGSSPELDQLATALVKAQGELRNVEPDAEGQVAQRRYKYLSLAKLLDEVRPILRDNGLAVIQTFEPADSETLRLTTTLIHTSGQWLGGTLTMPLPQVTPQGAGSAASYARRYSLTAMLGIAADEDDDAAEASRFGRGRSRRGPTSDPSYRGDPFFNLKIAELADQPLAQRRFFALIQNDFGWDHATALKKLGISSFSTDVGDRSVQVVLNSLALLHSSEANGD